MNEYYNMDCMDGMKSIPDNFYDLAIVDPPYGISATNMTMGSTKRNGKQYISTAEKIKKGRLNQGSGKLKNRILNTMNCDWDFTPPGEDYFIELFRVSKNQIIWGGNYFNLPPTRGIIAWDKMQPWKNFSQFELAWTSFDRPAALFKYSNTGGNNKEKKIHPTQKPINLYKWLLSEYAKEGDKILDTHVGSASSLIACHELGFDYMGFEKDKKHYQDSKNRLDRYKQQINIFNL